MEPSRATLDNEQTSSRPFARLEKPLVFWAILLGLLTTMGAVMVHVAEIESTTYDEPLYLSVGLEYWTTGNFWSNHEHPPLSKLLAALPLLPLDLRLPSENADFRDGSPQRPFLYGNRQPPARILFLGRLPFIILTLLFGVVLALWARSRFGAPAALIALAFYSLDPTVISHGHYAATDFIATVFIFLTCVAWERYLRTGSWWAAALTGTLLGLALASKFSALILLGALPLLYLLHRFFSSRKQPLLRAAAAGVVVAVFAAGVVSICYLDETRRSLSEEAPRTTKAMDESLISGRLFTWAAKNLGLPSHAFLAGVAEQEDHNRRGHSAYLMGETSEFGWWYFFPLVLLWKTPLALLAGLIAVLALAVIQLVRYGPAPLKATGFVWSMLVSVPALMLGLSMSANINIGHRYILGVYPFLYVLVAAALVRFRAHWLALALVLLLMVENVSIAPHYLAYFSPLFGGAGNAPKYLIDSNIDWGQDLLKLRGYLDSQSVDEPCLSYFGKADILYHGFTLRMVPLTGDVEGRSHAECMAAVSATYLYGHSGGAGFRWLREREPVAKVGYSIYVYDLREHSAEGP